MNKTRLISTISFICVFSVVIISSCVKDKGKLPVAATSVAVSSCDTITYTKHIKPLIDAYCISCHANPPSGGAPISLSNYSEVKVQADGGRIKARVIDKVAPGPMPPADPSPTAAEKDLIMCWLNNGKKE